MRARSLAGTLAVLIAGGGLANGCGGDGNVFGTATGTSSSSGTATGTGGSSSGTGGASSSGTGGASSSGTGGASSSGSGGAGGAGHGVGDPCTWDLGDCGPDLYCDAPGCQEGTCQPILPTDGQSKDFDPICGCDGISYFNWSIAQSQGVAMLHGDRCNGEQDVDCHPESNPCPAGYHCNLQLGSGIACLSPNAPGGACWGLPESCDPDFPNMAEGRPCGSPASPCLDVCTLMKNQTAWYPENLCF